MMSSSSYEDLILSLEDELIEPYGDDGIVTIWLDDELLKD